MISDASRSRPGRDRRGRRTVRGCQRRLRPQTGNPPRPDVRGPAGSAGSRSPSPRTTLPDSTRSAPPSTATSPPENTVTTSPTSTDVRRGRGGRSPSGRVALCWYYRVVASRERRGGARPRHLGVTARNRCMCCPPAQSRTFGTSNTSTTMPASTVSSFDGILDPRGGLPASPTSIDPGWGSRSRNPTPSPSWRIPQSRAGAHNGGLAHA